MPQKILQSLEGVAEILLIPLYVKARESQRPNAMLRDDNDGSLGFGREKDCPSKYTGHPI
jgi:hypothetical protein